MQNILQTRLVPDKLPAGMVKRQALLNKISQNIEKGLILICAPAGYGKTSLVQNFLQDSPYSYSWLHIHHDMNNFYSLMKYMVYSLQTSFPEFGKATLQLIEDYRERLQLSKDTVRIVNDITETFLNEAYVTIKKDHILVIDDLGNIDNSKWVKLMFENIFENPVPGLHMVITTRNMPEFSTSVLNAKRKFLKLEIGDLSFELPEIRKLMLEHYGIDASEKAVSELLENVGGWITGIHLILQSYGSNFNKIKLDRKIILEDIYTYFTEDIFNGLEDETKEFLMFTSLLESFSTDMCNILLKTDRAGKIINELLAKNIFIQVNSTTEGTHIFSYQVLFRKFLNQKLEESIPEEQINRFLVEVSLFFAGKEDFSLSINYALKAKDYSRAKELIASNYQKYFDSGSFEIIWEWLGKLGDNQIETDPRLLYIRAIVLRFYIGNLEESIRSIDKAVSISEKKSDQNFLVKCRIIRARNLISLGKIAEAISDLVAISKVKSDTESEAQILFLTAYSHYQNSDYDNAVKILDKATELLEDDSIEPENLTDIRLDVFNLYGHIYLIRGDFSKSVSYYERVVNKGEKLVDRYETICNLVLLHSLTGKFERALEYLKGAKTISGRISIPIFRITFLLAEQAMKFEIGDYEGSIGLLLEMNKIAKDLNHKYYTFLSYSLIADSYYSLNNLGKAEEYYDIAFSYLNDSSKMERIQYSVSKALMLKKAEPIAEIEPVLMEAYEYYKVNKFIYDRTQIAFHLADYYRKTGNSLSAITFLKEALMVSREKEYISFLQRNLEIFVPLYDLALANNIEKEFIKTITSDAEERKNISWISDEYRSRINENQAAYYDVDIRLFGKGEVRIRGKLIEENEWSKKKWKLIFFYVMLQPQKSISKERIIDIFYPDTSPESADNIFHQLISKFRNLLKFSYTNELHTLPVKEHSKKAKKSESVKAGDDVQVYPQLFKYEDKFLRINNDLRFYIDSEDFEQISKAVPLEKDETSKIRILETAADLYRGDFLEGNYETWCEEARTAYRTQFISMSEELVRLLFRDQQFEKVLHYADNLNRFDKLNLVSNEFLFRAYAVNGKKELAKAKYHQFKEQYEKEFEEPLPFSIPEIEDTTGQTKRPPAQSRRPMKSS